MKTYVEVICSFSCNGQIKPMYIKWGNGTIYEITKINKIIPLKRDDSTCIQFSCQIGSNTRNLFLEEGKWYVEHRSALYN